MIGFLRGKFGARVRILWANLLARRDRNRAKRIGELGYWMRRAGEERVLSNVHYECFFTRHFDLDPMFYAGKRVLDIGCGPRGSLEWAAAAAGRIGVDPLAYEYRSLGTAKHAMDYIAASSDTLPFADGVFDVVTSFNSLDHVDDLEATIKEIPRVLRPGGIFLLLVEVNHRPTALEPITLDWDVAARLSAVLPIVRQRRYAKGTGGIYESIRAGTSYDDSAGGAGYLSVKFERVGRGQPSAPRQP